MNILAKRNSIDPDIIELYCCVNDEPKYLAAIMHADHFNGKEFPILDQSDKAYLFLMED